MSLDKRKTREISTSIPHSHTFSLTHRWIGPTHSLFNLIFFDYFSEPTKTEDHHSQLSLQKDW
ncbi:hypothetical protein EBS43_00055 [bacterium]|nr:hypothetical protein [bacterium]